MPASHDKCIITAALAGAATMKHQNENVPYTTEEFITEIVKCHEAGASIVHIHARDPENGLPTADLEILGKIVEGARKETDIILNLSTAIGIGATPDQRISVVEEFKPEMASLNTATMNFAVGDWKEHSILFEMVFQNTFEMLVRYARAMKEAGTKPELEIYDMGGLYNVLFVRPQDVFVEPLHFQFVWGVLGGMPFSTRNFAMFMDTIPEDATFSSCGVGPAQFWGAFHAAVNGGHIRVGLEDNIWLSKGRLAEGSWEQVRKATEIIKLADREVATPAEAREMLGLKSAK
ncbi:MAG: 3-keto-5-aminohexanoate cleavage protein [Actinobacteria bacterium]|nr:3-keto-5-aminohexanoate cleavage protein [Actinomycetota bacterium]MBU1942704.1 3-keto-5-aminohexanoate cleavage protein [Actinomycetota bacterium]MBU2686026.1 3-keto-5-aminohexanoate cleavage protein [Actinomycetota bacterium]